MTQKHKTTEYQYDFDKLQGTAEIKRATKRCEFFQSAFDLYQKQMDKLGLRKISLHPMLLANAVESYYLDIHRVKTFHGMERADHFKVAGYTVKWLTKIRPIQVLDRPENDGPNQLQRRVLLLNADFALINALIMAGVDRNKIPDEGIYLDWLYTAQYRYLDGGVLAQMFEAAARTWPR